MEGVTQPLTKLAVGGMGKVKKIHTVGKLRRRMLDLGIVEGTKIEVLHVSPAGDPVAYSIRGAVIALRAEDAQKIIVDTRGEKI